MPDAAKRIVQHQVKEQALMAALSAARARSEILYALVCRSCEMPSHKRFRRGSMQRWLSIDGRTSLPGLAELTICRSCGGRDLQMRSVPSLLRDHSARLRALAEIEMPDDPQRHRHAIRWSTDMVNALLRNQTPMQVTCVDDHGVTVARRR